MHGTLSGTLGIDLGSINIKAAWLPPSGGGAASGATPAWATPAQGRPLAALEALVQRDLRRAIGASRLRLSLTGAAQDLLRGAVPATCTNEVVATALAVAAAHPGTRTVIDLGGQFTKWILLDGDRVADFAVNGLCAAGSGAFLEQQASRLKLTAGELGTMAHAAKRGATIAGRCSVFAKSDMIHLQQKGTPLEEIAYGVCLALVRTFVATVLGGRTVEPPVVLVGGGSANPGLVRAFREVLALGDADVTVPEDHTTLGARGAALAASVEDTVSIEDLLFVVAAAARGQPHPPLPSRGEGREGGLPDRRGDALEPLARWAPRRQVPDEDPPREVLAPGPFEVYLGIDVGSVSTNVVAIDRDGQVLQGIYLPTRGRPIEVLDESLRLLAAKFGGGADLEVLAVGATGSGRHLAARALGADTVKNEITAQMASAAAYFPEVDTVFEIGGQDSKYIGARDGRLSDFEMNKICAAGTGSFLEEQAERLGVQIKGEFSRLALASDAPRDLGSRCTVFMDSELVRAQQAGVPREDICAGLAYSIARNYLEKVVAGRPVGKTVVFQGGTASNDSVVAAMRAVTGTEIVVHPYNRISGAIGAALLAARDHRRAPRRPSAFRGYDACAGATTRSFECKHCTNRCQVIRVEVGGLISHFGDTCERYTARDGARPSVVPDQPNLFKQRELLFLESLPPARPGRPRAVLPRASNLLETAPFWAAALDALGFDVTLTPPTTLELLALGAAGFPNELCLPIKIASGHVRRALADDPDAVVVIPSLLELPDRSGDGETHPCLYSQELPNLLRHAEGARVLAPQCSISATRDGLSEAVSELQRLLGATRREARAAVEAGVAAQAGFDRARAELGRRAFDEVRDRAVIVLGRPYNLHDPLLNLDLARRLERLSLPAIPMDVLPAEDMRLEPRFDRLMWRYSRDQLRALELIRRQESRARSAEGAHVKLFPLWVSCFGCGLDAFAFKHLRDQLHDRPSLMLEFDEHRGEAGLVTRLEAFVDEIEEHIGRGVRRPRVRLGRTAPLGSSGRFVVPHISDHAFAAAAALRSIGHDAVVLPEPDQETVRLGEEVSEGGECHPWVVMTGELVRWATSSEAMRGDTFYYPQAKNPCLIGQYGDGHRHVLDRIGLGDRYNVLAFEGASLIRHFGGHAAMNMYEAIAAVDLLISVACCRRPYEITPGSVDRVYRESVEEVCEAIVAHEDSASAFESCLRRLLAVPIREGEARPLVGVCGDLYTRTNALGNADLFARLEALGCQVWPHSYLAGLIDSGSRHHMVRWAERGQLGPALRELLTAVGTSSRSAPLRGSIPPELRRLCLDPDPFEIRRLAEPYTGPRTNNLVAENVGAMVDYARRGADGVLSAVGIGCMVGVAADGAMRRVRDDHPDVPMITLAYGCSEGPAQRIKLETFVHQVHEAFRRR